MAKDRRPVDPWSRRPEEMSRESLVQIVRAPSRGTLKFIVLSHDITGRGTHYWGNRTMPCRAGCEACNAGHAPRWLGWLCVMVKPQDQVALFEMTETNALILDDEFRNHRTMRGLQISVHRPSGRNNGRVVMRVHGVDPQKLLLAEAIDVKKALYKIWQLKPEDDQPMTAGPPQELSQQNRDEYANAKHPKVGEHTPTGVERARRRRTADDLHQRAGEDGGVWESTTTDATLGAAIAHAEQVSQRSNGVGHIATFVPPIVGASKQSSIPPHHGLQSVRGINGAEQLDLRAHD